MYSYYLFKCLYIIFQIHSLEFTWYDDIDSFCFLWRATVMLKAFSWTYVCYWQYSIYPRYHSYSAAKEQRVGSYPRTIMVFIINVWDMTYSQTFNPLNETVGQHLYALLQLLCAYFYLHAYWFCWLYSLHLHIMIFFC